MAIGDSTQSTEEETLEQKIDTLQKQAIELGAKSKEFYYDRNYKESVKIKFEELRLIEICDKLYQKEYSTALMHSYATASRLVYKNELAEAYKIALGELRSAGNQEKNKEERGVEDAALTIAVRNTHKSCPDAFVLVLSAVNAARMARGKLYGHANAKTLDHIFSTIAVKRKDEAWPGTEVMKSCAEPYIRDWEPELKTAVIKDLENFSLTELAKLGHTYLEPNWCRNAEKSLRTLQNPEVLKREICVTADFIGTIAYLSWIAYKDSKNKELLDIAYDAKINELTLLHKLESALTEGLHRGEVEPPTAPFVESYSTFANILKARGEADDFAIFMACVYGFISKEKNEVVKNRERHSYMFSLKRLKRRFIDQSLPSSFGDLKFIITSQAAGYFGAPEVQEMIRRQFYTYAHRDFQAEIDKYGNSESS